MPFHVPKREIPRTKTPFNKHDQIMETLNEILKRLEKIETKIGRLK